MRSGSEKLLDNRSKPKTMIFRIDFEFLYIGFLKELLAFLNELLNVCNNRIDKDNEYFISNYYNNVYSMQQHNINPIGLIYIPHFWFNENMYHYYDMDIRNMLNSRKITMNLITNLTSRICWQNRYTDYDSSNIVVNCLTKSNCYKIRINWFYLAKYLSRPKYSLLNNVSIKSMPKTSLLIILLLFMCGDTGASINPGPMIEIGKTHTIAHTARAGAHVDAGMGTYICCGERQTE